MADMFYEEAVALAMTAMRVRRTQLRTELRNAPPDSPWITAQRKQYEQYGEAIEVLKLGKDPENA